MRIAIALFDGVEELDFAGPWEVLTFWAREVAAPGSSVVTVASTLEPVTAAKGLRVLPDTTWAQLGAIDVDLGHRPRGTAPDIGRRPAAETAPFLCCAPRDRSAGPRGTC